MIISEIPMNKMSPTRSLFRFIEYYTKEPIIFQQAKNRLRI